MTKPIELRSPWTLAEAVEMLSTIQVVLRPDWYVGLTGSVLYSGRSDNDLDILVYPATTETTDLEPLKLALQRFGMKMVVPSSVVQRKWRSLGSLDAKIVEVWEWNGKRLDIFFVR